MKIEYVVHGVHGTPLGANVEHEGKPARGAVDSLTVELVAKNPRFGTMTWRLVGDEITELSPKLRRDDTIVFDI